MADDVQGLATASQAEPEAPQEDTLGGMPAPEAEAPGAADAAQLGEGMEEPISEQGELGSQVAGESAVSGTVAAGDTAPGEPPSQDELAALREDEVAFRWQASEYVHHNKGMNWYAGLAAGVAVLVGIAALLHQWIDIVLFAMVGAALVIYGRKPPRTMTYELTPKGIRIDGKDYMYGEFRSFGVLPDVEWHTIDLEPTKRFSPRITLLFSDEDFKPIVGHLELHLPRVDRKPDAIELLTRYLRF